MSQATTALESLRQLPAHQARVVIEYHELETRRAALAGFIKGAIFPTLPINERSRLQRQHNHMTDYALVLDERVAAFGTEE